MAALIENEDAYRHLNTETALLLKQCAKIEMPINQNSEVTDMCQAWQDMANDCRAEGRAQGCVEGRAEGRAQGRAEGRAEGQMVEKKATAFRLKTMGYENGLIADILNTNLSMVQGWFSEPSETVG